MKYLNFVGVAVDPRVHNSLPAKAVVTDGKISICSQDFLFVSDSYANGTEVLVQISRNYYCRSLSEIAQEKLDTEGLRNQANLKRDRIESERIAEAEVFNNSLNVPVQWSPEVKHILSGLSENSWGDGRRRNSKAHIYLSEALEGRIKRSANSFLCAPSKGAHYNELIQVDKFAEKVTCPKCLEIARRWNNI